MTMTRRNFIKTMGAGATLATGALYGCAGTTSGAGGGKVVVIGGGFGGATAAKYIRMWAPQIEVTLVEPNASFVSCPFSNRVLGGNLKLDELTVSYDRLQRERDAQLANPAAVGVGEYRQEVHGRGAGGRQPTAQA